MTPSNDRFSYEEIASVGELVAHPGFKLLLEALEDQNALISNQMKTADTNEKALGLLAMWRAHSAMYLTLKSRPHLFLAEINERYASGELNQQLVDENPPNFRNINKASAPHSNPYRNPQPPPPPAHPSNIIPFPGFPPRNPDPVAA